MFKDMDELCQIYIDKINYRDNLIAAQEQSDLEENERNQLISMVLESSPVKEIPKNLKMSLEWGTSETYSKTTYFEESPCCQNSIMFLYKIFEVSIHFQSHLNKRLETTRRRGLSLLRCRSETDSEK